MAKAKITPIGGIKVIVADDQGNPCLLGTIPVWEHATPTQKWVMEHTGAELTAQCVFVKKEETFSMENELNLHENKTKIIKSKFRVSIKEC